MTCTTGYISGSRLTAELTPIKTDLAQATSVNATQSQQITALQAVVTAGAASTVPAAGVLAGTLPSNVVLNNTANFGTGAAATDTALGVVSLAVAANYPSASNVEAVTPAYLTVMNAAIKAGNVGTHPFVTAPVSAPSLADPAIIKYNASNETFMYNGAMWVLVANGFNADGINSGALANSNPVLVTLTMPRAGRINIRCVVGTELTGANTPFEYFYVSFGPFPIRSIYTGRQSHSFPTLNGSQEMDVTAGQVISLRVSSSSAGFVDGFLAYTYIR